MYSKAILVQAKLELLVDSLCDPLLILSYILNTQCTSAINQLTKGRNREEESSELQSLDAEVLLKNYKQHAPSKVSKNMKLS
jgi:hypothetical protein